MDYKEEEEAEEIWEEIERAESYLVSSMYEEATSLACSIIEKRMNEKRESERDKDDEEREREREVLECCGMIVLQSLHNLHVGSSSSYQILTMLSSSIQLKLIPPPLILTGACLQMSSSSPDKYSGVARIIEEYLKEVDDVKVAEFFVIEILATALSDTPRAISWLHHNSPRFPQHVTEGLLTKLQQLSKPVSLNPPPPQPEPSSLSLDKHKNQPVLSLSRRVKPGLWWLHILNPKLMIGCLALLVYWTLRRKQLTLKGMVNRQASSLKKAALELWQLAFSHPLPYL